MNILDPLWFTTWAEQRNDYSPVIIWNRLWTQRNIEGKSFGPTWDSQFEDLLRGELKGLIQATGQYQEPFTFDDQHRPLLSLMLEAGLVGPGDLGQDWKTCFLRREGLGGVFLMRQSHLQWFSWTGGFPGLDWARAELANIQSLEAKTAFAVHPKWGYLTPSLSTLGSGTEWEFLLHLPALVWAGGLMKVLEHLEGSGFEVRGFFQGGGEDFGDFFLLRYKSGLGGSFPYDFSDKIPRVLGHVVEFEKKVRNTVIRDKETQVLDLFGRALGLLQGARILGLDEATEALSKLRWAYFSTQGHGLQLDVLEKLLYLIRVGTLKISRTQEGKEEVDLDELRADLVRESLFGKGGIDFHV
jgi:protein-arginine kinase